jgi:hypothetical protein
MKAMESYVQAYRLHGARAAGEWFAEMIALAWQELRSPPRPAWLIVAVRSARRPKELLHRFTRP